MPPRHRWSDRQRPQRPPTPPVAVVARVAPPTPLPMTPVEPAPAVVAEAPTEARYEPEPLPAAAVVKVIAPEAPASPPGLRALLARSVGLRPPSA
jgi:hypothetical protein